MPLGAITAMIDQYARPKRPRFNATVTSLARVTSMPVGFDGFAIRTIRPLVIRGSLRL